MGKIVRQINDSDLMIIEHDNTIVSVSDSESEVEMQSKPQDNNVVLLDDDESEEGELMDDERKEENTNYAFEINFQKEDYFERYGTVIAETLVKTFKNSKEPIKCNLSRTDLRIEAYIGGSSSEQCSKPTSKESSPDLTGIKELFTIDASPNEMPEIVQVPSYKRSIKNVLDEESNESKRKKIEDADACQRVRPAMACFNCGVSGHNLRDCPKKRDGRRIQRARNKFRPTAETRYHVRIENKYPHLRPGIISEPLRKALGLRSGEIPFFYYRMRALGYPPGWLEDAKVQPSGLALISADVSEDLPEMLISDIL